MTTEPPRLAIHVFGAGKGESVALQMPDGRWGVVDCYAGSVADPATNPTLQFLLERGVTDLEFLCMTHPHEDHFRGMSQLLERFPVRYFWLSDGLSGDNFRKLADYLVTEAEEIDRSEELENSKEFVRIFGLVERKRRTQVPPLVQKRSSPTSHLYPVPFEPDAPFRIIGLAPSGNQVSRYNRGLIRSFTADGAIRDRLPQAHHNIISVGLLVAFGRTRIILGGDVERDGWRDAIDEMGAGYLAADAVKVSHHGSPTGYCEGLWGHFAARGHPVAVVTSYAAQGLPSRAALDEISPHCSGILTTCMTALKQGKLPTGLDPAVFRSRLALMQKMGKISDDARHRCGRCTLVFDDQGRCVERELVPPADQADASE